MCNAAGKYSWSKCWEPKLGGSSHEQITIDRQPSRDSQVSTTFLIMLYPIIVARTTNDVWQMIVEHHHSIDFTALLAIHSPLSPFFTTVSNFFVYSKLWQVSLRKRKKTICLGNCTWVQNQALTNTTSLRYNFNRIHVILNFIISRTELNTNSFFFVSFDQHHHHVEDQGHSHTDDHHQGDKNYHHGHRNYHHIDGNYHHGHHDDVRRVCWLRLKAHPPFQALWFPC